MAKKPKPAPTMTNDGYYRLTLCIHGKQHKKFAIKNQHRAYMLQARVNSLVADYKYGLIEVPSSFTASDYIFYLATNKNKPQEVKISPTTISDLIEKYQSIAASGKEKSTYKTELIHIRHLQRFLKTQESSDPALESITVAFFDNYKKFRADQNISNDTINKELRTYQTIFKMALKHKYVKENVVKDVDRLQSETPKLFRTLAQIKQCQESGKYTDKEIRQMRRFCYLKPGEIGELLELAKDNWVYPFLLTVAYTGCRRCEIMRLEWGNIDFEKEILWADSRKQSKTKKKVLRPIPIHPNLLEVLQKQSVISGKNRWVFPGPDGEQIKARRLRAIEKIVKGTKFEGIGFHALRHSIASNLNDKGVNKLVIRELLGHETEEMGEHYIHLEFKVMKKAIEDMEYK